MWICIRICIWCVFDFLKLRKTKVKARRLTLYALRAAGEEYRFFERVTRYTWQLYVILGSEEINGSLSETCPLRCGPTTRGRKIYDKARLNFFHANNQPTNQRLGVSVRSYIFMHLWIKNSWMEEGIIPQTNLQFHLSSSRLSSRVYPNRKSLATRYWIIIQAPRLLLSQWQL